MGILYSTCVVVIVTLSLVGTLCHVYQDSLPQRIALGMLGLGGSAELWCQWAGVSSINARVLLVAGCALYGVGTALKTWHYHRIKP